MYNNPSTVLNVLWIIFAHQIINIDTTNMNSDERKTLKDCQDGFKYLITFTILLYVYTFMNQQLNNVYTRMFTRSR